MDKYIIETQATILDIDGEKWLIILNSFDYGSRESKHWASEGIDWLHANCRNYVTGMKRPDGTFGFACSAELEEKIRARIGPDHPWRTVRLFPPPDALSKPNEPE